MVKTIYKFKFKLLKLKEENLRMPWKVIELYRKQWADNRLINSVQLVHLIIIPITKVTNQEMDQMDQLQELTLIKVEFTAQVAPSAVLLDQVQEPELTVESQVPNQFLAWLSAHVNQIFKMSKTPDEILSKLTEAKNNQYWWAPIILQIVVCVVNFTLSR